MNQVILAAKNIYKSFGGVHALKDVSFNVAPAEIHCLVGENGSGKSTLVKIISGVHKPDSGEIVLNGNSYSKMSVINSIHEGVQVIYQDLSLFPYMSVAENIATNKLVGQNRKFIDWKEINKIAEEQLARVNISLDLKSSVEKLSISNMQIVAICRALSQEAKILFMDEPTTALTKKEVDKLLSIVMDLKKNDMSIVFISHKLDEIMEVADNVTIFRDGNVVGDFNASELDESKLVYYMTGKNIEYNRYNRRADHSDENILSIKKLTREPNYRNISFGVRRGDIIGLTGLLGSGRTELALTLFGLNPQDSGDVEMGGKEYRPKTPTQAVAAGVSLLPENRQTQGAYLGRNISDNISAAILEKVSGKFGILKNRKEYNIANDAVKRLGIKVAGIQSYVEELSGGNQQKVVLGKWVETEPTVLILDSPTVGVDIGSKSEIYEYIQELAHQGLGIIMISDELPELVANCNRLIVMQSGNVVGELEEQDLNDATVKDKIKNIMMSEYAQSKNSTGDRQ